jgi:lantibiotic modifying enzyme
MSKVPQFDRQTLPSLLADESLAGQDPVLWAFGEGVFEPAPGPETIAVTDAPFVEILQPLADEAITEIAAFSEQYSWLAGALPGLRGQLVQRMGSIANLPLYLWFQTHHSKATYEQFSRDMHSGAAGWNNFVGEYPELERLPGILSKQWQGASLEFLQRLAVDRAALGEFLSLPDLEVESVTAGWSDPHGHGRSVIRVSLPGGQQIAYKPRSLAAELSLAQLVDRIAASNPELRIPHAAVLSRPTHGWMTWLAPSACMDAPGWYAAAGRLQVLLQAVGATDAHMGNCVATAEGPALIDCECLLTPQAKGWKPADALDALLAKLQQSALLPDARRPVGDPDLSGLFGCGGQATGYRIPVWSQSPAGGVSLSLQPALLRPQVNLPLGEACSISRMAACAPFLEGFAAMHRYLASHAAEVLEALEPLRHAPMRALLRSTRRYTQILSDSIHPRLLRDGEERRRAIAAMLAEEPLPVAAPGIVEAEAEALERLDVPLFHAEGLDLTSEDHILAEGYFLASGHGEMESRLQAMAEEDLPRILSTLRLLWIMSL